MLSVGRLVRALVLPGRDVAEVLVIAQCLALGRLILFAEVAAARFFTVQRVNAQQLAEFKEVGDPARLFERLVDVVGAARHQHVLPVLLAQLANPADCALKTLPVAGHSALFPKNLAEFTMERIDCPFPFDREQALLLAHDGFHCAANLDMALVHLVEFRARQIVADCIWKDEVAVRQSLHQRAGAEPVCAVIGKVRFAGDEQARDSAHQLVVHPKSAHRVMDGRVDAHRNLIWILVRDALIHVEQVSVPLLDDLGAQAA